MSSWWKASQVKWQIIIAVVLLFVSGIGFLEAHYLDRFYPGVTIGKISVGGKSYDEVFQSFKIGADALTENGLQFTFEGAKGKREVKIPLSRTGLTADNLVEYFSLGSWEADIRQAYEWGRAGSLPRRIAEQTWLLFGNKNFRLSAVPHEEALQSLLSRELKGFLKEAVPAHFVPFGAEIAISAEKAGENLNNQEIISIIRQKLTILDSAPEHFIAKPEAPWVTADKLQPFLKLATEVARTTKLVFHYQDRSWRVSGITLATWLTLKDEKNAGIDTNKLETFLSKTVAPVIDNPPRNSRFEMRGRQLVEILPGRSGNVVDVKKTAERVERVVSGVQRSFTLTSNLLLALRAIGPEATFQPQSGAIEIPIEITQSDPKVTQKTIDQYGINDLVGSARTSFRGSSADRKHNIEVGVSKLNGLLLAPGEEFSAVTGIGATTEEEGFVKEYVIKEDKSVKELGGGLCQLATTLFRLALDAGLPITERVNHRYVVSYYGPGLDATIYGPKPDLRFVNDTGNYLLLQGKVEDDQLVFEFYGQRDGRVAQVSTPELSEEKPAPETKYVISYDLPIGQIQCSETPRKGLTADVTYTVRYADGEVKEQKFHSVYQPWQKICLMGVRQ